MRLPPRTKRQKFWGSLDGRRAYANALIQQDEKRESAKLAFSDGDGTPSFQWHSRTRDSQTLLKARYKGVPETNPLSSIEYIGRVISWIDSTRARGEMVVSPNTIAKAYSELEHEGLLELRHGSGAFVLVSRRTRHLADRLQSARKLVADVVEELRENGLVDEEIRRMFEAELLNPAIETVRKR